MVALIVGCHVEKTARLDFATNLALLGSISENVEHAICPCSRHAVAGSANKVEKVPN